MNLLQTYDQNDYGVITSNKHAYNYLMTTITGGLPHLYKPQNQA